MYNNKLIIVRQEVNQEILFWIILGILGWPIKLYYTNIEFNTIYLIDDNDIIVPCNIYLHNNCT